MKKTIITLVAALVGAAEPASAATVITDPNGQLTGAQNIDVAGTLYDVEFTNGSCVSLFSGCDPTTFAFQTPDLATAAARALLDQVLLDSQFGLFDSNPALTRGCDQPSCQTLIPYKVDGSTFFWASSDNFAPGSGSDKTSIALGRTRAVHIASSTEGSGRFQGVINFARFTLANSAVPEPSTWAMMLLGFFGVGAGLRRKRPGRSLSLA